MVRRAGLKRHPGVLNVSSDEFGMRSESDEMLNPDSNEKRVFD
jgi:hypothetical protein